MKRTIYIETSVISYLTSKPSRDIIISAYQQITKDWWEMEMRHYTCYVSDFVIDEISRGDENAAKVRIESISFLDKIALNQTVLDLVRVYEQGLSIPDKAKMDIFHLAIAAGNGIDYILSWNFKHIANAAIKEKLFQINSQLGLRTPMICTPEELIGGDND